MKTEIAKAIVEAAEYLEIEGVSLYEGYSGRGMYGKTTTGISADAQSDINRAIVYVGYKLGKGELPELADMEIEDLAKELDFRHDSLGRGVIVY